MKKITLLVAAVLVAANVFSVDLSWTRIWENSATLGTNPTYVGTANRSVRSIALGTFENQKVLVVPSREGGTFVKLINPEDGTVIKDLITTGISGGAITMSDAAVTQDGKILVTNVVNAAYVSTSTSGVFKVYQWNNSTSAPTVALTYNLPAAYRIGDHVTVYGSISDGSCVIYAASTAAVTSKAHYFKFSMIPDVANGGYKFDTPVIYEIGSITATGGYAAVEFLSNGQYYYKFNGSQIKKYNSDNTFVHESSSSLIGAGNSVKHLVTSPATTSGDPDTTYLVYFRYGAGQERANIVTFPNNEMNNANAKIVCYLPSLGTNTNGDGCGRIQFEKVNNDYYLYVLSTNNGIGKYKISWPSLTTSINTTKELLKITKTASILKVEGSVPVSIELFNTLGQKVQSVTNRNELNISNLRGVHIVKVNVNGKVSTQKISL